MAGAANKENFSSCLQILTGDQHPSVIPRNTSSLHRNVLPSTLQCNTQLGEMIMVINVLPCNVPVPATHLGDEPKCYAIIIKVGVSYLSVFSIRQYDPSKVVHLDVGKERLSVIFICLPQCKNLTILFLSLIPTTRIVSNILPSNTSRNVGLPCRGSPTAD